MGPAFETFIQVVLILALVATPLILVLRKPVARLYRRACEEDQKQMAEVRAREQECLDEQEARKKAMEELARDCNQDLDKGTRGTQYIDECQPDAEAVERRSGENTHS